MKEVEDAKKRQQIDANNLAAIQIKEIDRLFAENFDRCLPHAKQCCEIYIFGWIAVRTREFGKPLTEFDQEELAHTAYFDFMADYWLEAKDFQIPGEKDLALLVEVIQLTRARLIDNPDAPGIGEFEDELNYAMLKNMGFRE